MRLNIEDSFFGDDRFIELVLIVGCRFKAVGICVLFWKQSFRYWKNDRGLIPFELFQRHTEWQTLIKVGLADKIGEFVYAKGSEERFSWVLQKIEAGKRGANKTNKLRYGGAQRSKAQLDEARPPSPSPSPSLITHVVSDIVCEKYTVRNLAELWNALKADTQPAVIIKTLTVKTARYRSAKARLAENPSLTYWENVIRLISQSAFCRGEVQIRKDSSPWIADFTWLVQIETHIKVMEGRYNHRSFVDKSKTTKTFTGEI